MAKSREHVTCNGRVVYTLPIFGTFYLDINVIDFKATKKFLPYEF